MRAPDNEYQSANVLLLEHILFQLRPLQSLAAKYNIDILRYILDMAVQEAIDVSKDLRAKSVKDEQSLLLQELQET